MPTGPIQPVANSLKPWGDPGVRDRDARQRRAFVIFLGARLDALDLRAALAPQRGQLVFVDACL